MIQNKLRREIRNAKELGTPAKVLQEAVQTTNNNLELLQTPGTSWKIPHQRISTQQSGHLRITDDDSCWGSETVGIPEQAALARNRMEELNDKNWKHIQLNGKDSRRSHQRIKFYRHAIGTVQTMMKMMCYANVRRHSLSNLIH
ncbi:hypothetical protein Tco_0047826 [Tanacetum coccineum]